MKLPRLIGKKTSKKESVVDLSSLFTRQCTDQTVGQIPHAHRKEQVV